MLNSANHYIRQRRIAQVKLIEAAENADRKTRRAQNYRRTLTPHLKTILKWSALENY
jgi:hypothetical protein